MVYGVCILPVFAITNYYFYFYRSQLNVSNLFIFEVPAATPPHLSSASESILSLSLRYTFCRVIRLTHPPESPPTLRQRSSFSSGATLRLSIGRLVYESLIISGSDNERKVKDLVS